MPAKSAVMRLGVVDEANSHIGTIEIPLPVKAPPDAPQVVRRSMPPVERELSFTSANSDIITTPFPKT